VSAADLGLINSTDLSAFKAHGGKLIVYHGGADGAFSVNATIDWYNGVNANESGNAANFARLFVVPGMNHCSGGPSTDDFDMFPEVVNWVEKGVAPAWSQRRAIPTTLEWSHAAVRSARIRNRPVIRVPVISTMRTTSAA
jgi:feruloyl esterase